MMSNSNYSIGLQRLEPVHTAYCGLHKLAENWSWARDVNGRDRDVCVPRPRRDVGTSRDRDVETETTTLFERQSDCLLFVHDVRSSVSMDLCGLREINEFMKNVETD